LLSVCWLALCWLTGALLTLRPTLALGWNRIERSWSNKMDGKTVLFELLMAGFFAVACVRAHGPVSADHRMSLGDFFRLYDRVERVRRTRWQWFSMVALLLVIRLQQPVPLGLEIMVAAQFLLFLALPVKTNARSGVRRP
jgi:hypothetical protein